MALTEFHFVLLYKDRVIGISSLNEELVYEEILPLVRQLSLTCILGSHFYSRSRVKLFAVSRRTQYGKRSGSTLISFSSS